MRTGNQRLIGLPWLVLAIVAIAPRSSSAQDPMFDSPAANDVPPLGTGRIWNLTAEPFVYQLRRDSGPCWSDDKVLPPGEYHTYREVDIETAVLAGAKFKNPYLVIQHAELGGVVRMRLTSRTNQGERLPNWFYVKDSNNYGRLIQSRSVDEALARQKELRQAKPFTPEQVRQIKKTLRANWVFYPIDPE